MSRQLVQPQARRSTINLGGLVVIAVAVLLPAARCPAQHLWWDKEGEKDAATCLYGETIVLVTIPGIYRLWLGPRPDRMRCLTKAGGDGTWIGAPA